jgi:DNA-directed RNA polymerase subunit RPC12/RpoP
MSMKLSKSYNLKAVNPGLARQWHPTKNDNLTPEQVTPGSNKRVWWKCEKGHEWISSIEVRNRGAGCPYCSGRKASKEYNLRTLHPELADQWHPKKNMYLTPEQVTPGSNKKVWWRCEKGHAWKSSVAHRTGGNGCPYCSGRRVTKERNLKTAHPELAKQWHPLKNDDLRPEQVNKSSRKRVWWNCEKGHEWITTVVQRSYQGSGCPECAILKNIRENSLMVINPGLAQQWHPTKNVPLRPTDVSYKSLKLVWWLCENGHVWKVSVLARTLSAGCPYCTRKKASKDYNLKIVNPQLASQWHPTFNGRLKPTQVLPMAKRKVWWQCEKGHEWRTDIAHRSNGAGCPYCAGKKATEERNLKILRPELAKQWHPKKNGNLTPEQVTPYAGKKVWWQCEKGHEWEAFILRRTRSGPVCPFCIGRRASSEYNLLTVYPELAKQWHPTKNGDLTPEQVTPRAANKVWWKCENGHEWKATIFSRSFGRGCSYCSGRKPTKERNLGTLHPELARQWHPKKNGDLTPGQVTPGSSKKVWWKCERGHEWRTRIVARTYGSGCPFCVRKNQTISKTT